MINLKPCPFCGGKPYSSDGNTKYYLKHKSKCYFHGKYDYGVQFLAFVDDEEIITLWNNRPTKDALRKEVAQLQADNRSLVEQVNKMVLKPNQEVIEWHNYPEEKPEPSRCCIMERKNFCYHIAHHSEIDGWLDSVTFDVLSEVKAWAYLPKGVINEHKTN